MQSSQGQLSTLENGGLEVQHVHALLRPFGLSLSEHTPSRIRIHHVVFVSVGVVVG
jgi:hypothetical protein